LAAIRDSSHGRFEPESTADNESLLGLFKNMFAPANRHKPENTKLFDPKYTASFNIFGDYKWESY
jgi:hypothetical protein